MRPGVGSSLSFTNSGGKMNTATNNHIAPILITWARVLVGAYLVWLPQQDGAGMVARQPVHLPYLGSLFGVPAFHKNYSPHHKPEPLRCHVGTSHLLHSKQRSQDCGIKTTRASLLIYGGGLSMPRFRHSQGSVAVFATAAGVQSNTGLFVCWRETSRKKIEV